MHDQDLFIHIFFLRMEDNRKKRERKAWGHIRRSAIYESRQPSLACLAHEADRGSRSF